MFHDFCECHKFLGSLREPNAHVSISGVLGKHPDSFRNSEILFSKWCQNWNICVRFENTKWRQKCSIWKTNAYRYVSRKSRYFSLMPFPPCVFDSLMSFARVRCRSKITKITRILPPNDGPQINCCDVYSPSNTRFFSDPQIPRFHLGWPRSNSKMDDSKGKLILAILYFFRVRVLLRLCRNITIFQIYKATPHQKSLCWWRQDFGHFGKIKTDTFLVDDHWLKVTVKKVQLLILFRMRQPREFNNLLSNLIQR